MILIPQIYIRNGKVALPEGIRPSLYREDPFETARAIKDAGGEAIYIIDLGFTALGVSPHVPIIKKIHDELGLALYVGGAFKSLMGVELFLAAGAELVVLASVAYQQPAFLNEACQKFPGRIAVHIDVKADHVTIPGYVVATNKTALDYAERFVESGVRFIFYSDVGANGQMSAEHFERIETFCKQVTARIICTSEIQALSDVEKIVMLDAPRLDGIVLGKSLYEGRMDLRSAITMVDDLTLAKGDESTMTEL